MSLGKPLPYFISRTSNNESPGAGHKTRRRNGGVTIEQSRKPAARRTSGASPYFVTRMSRRARMLSADVFQPNPCPRYSAA